MKKTPGLRAFLIVVVAAASYLLYSIESCNSGYEKKTAAETPDRMSRVASTPNKLSNWPPKVGEKFPDIAFRDHRGEPFSFASLQGRPTLIEMVAMTCAGCQGFSGGGKYGGFKGFASQPFLKSMSEYFPDYTGGLQLYDGPLNFVQIVVYDLELEAPEPEELALWREHFKLDGHTNVYVVTGGEPLANKDSFQMIPGFLLLDKNGVLKYDSAGHRPKHDLFRVTLPAVRSLL